MQMAIFLRRSLLLFVVLLGFFLVVFSIYNSGDQAGSSMLENVAKLDSTEARTIPRRLSSKDSDIVSALNQRWMTWTDIDSPGNYRACVPYPTPDNVFDQELSGGMVAADSTMTILRCLDHCISLEYTYAALTKGTQCFCTNVHQSSRLLSYVDNALCSIPCAGDANYNCGGQRHFSLYRTSVPDVRCCNISLGKKDAYPLIALASYPRSGNTWTRQLIEKGTGIYTGSIYWKVERDSEISFKVFKGGNIDYESKQTICVKTHRDEEEHVKFFDAAVLLIRNPYRTIVAEVFRIFMFEKAGSVNDSMEYFKSKKWASFVDQQGRRWHKMNLRWIKNTKRLLVIHYEQLEADTERQLTRIVEFLGQTPNGERISCSIQDNPSSLSTGVALGNHGVKTRAYLTKDPFSQSMHTIMDAFIISVNQSLIAKGQDALPNDYGNIAVY